MTRHKGERILIPIDHGLCMPDSLEVHSWELVWMEWDQAKEPFTTRTLRYIENIDIEADLAILKTNYNIRSICLRNFKICNILLKKCAKSGLTLH